MINKCVFTLGNNNSIKSVVKFFIIFPNVTPSRVLVENRRISILINPQFERKSIISFTVYSLICPICPIVFSLLNSTKPLLIPFPVINLPIVQIAGLIARRIVCQVEQDQELKHINQLDRIKLPNDLIFSNIPGLSQEVIEILEKSRPSNLGQASRLSGIGICRRGG